MKPGRDLWWHELMTQAQPDCLAEPLDSEAPLFILYTSGSTGKPKGIRHTTAGYNLYAKKTFEWVFDHRPEDVFWCTADCGWITGHTYVVYGPLTAGATIVMYEGAEPRPTRAGSGRSSKSTKSRFSTPRRPRSARSSSGATSGSIGTIFEPPPVGDRGRRNQSRGLDVVPPQDRPRMCPIVDTWWQTETGGIMMSPLPGAIATKPGSARSRCPG